MSVIVPPIKCQGIKTKLIDFIRKSVQCDPNQRWVEPFLGSGAVVFNMQPKKALLCDNHPALIQFYKDLKADILTPVIVREYLEHCGSKLSTGGESYFYARRKAFNQTPTSLDLLFLNRSCFNGLIRYNKSGEFNTPFCQNPNKFSKTYIDKIVNLVTQAQQLVQTNDWEFKVNPWQETFKELQPDDYMYLDPPYMGRNATYFTQWVQDDMSELTNALKRTQNAWAMSMWVSYGERMNPYMDEWVGWPVKTEEHYYRVGSHVEYRSEVSEGLILNRPKNGSGTLLNLTSIPMLSF